MRSRFLLLAATISSALFAQTVTPDWSKLNDEALSYVERVVKRQPDNLKALRGVVDFNSQRAIFARMANDDVRWRESIDRAHRYGLLLLEKEPDDSVGRLFVAQADVETGHADEAYKRIAALGDIAVGSELAAVFGTALFFTDRQGELIALCPKAPATAKLSVCTYAALGAALKNDAETSAQMATEAAKDEHTDLHWVMELTTQRFATPDTDVKRFALALAQHLDTAQRTLDGKAVRDALLDYVKQIAPKTP